MKILSICNTISALAAISNAVAVHGREVFDSLVPIAMVTHYSDDKCSTLDVSSTFQGYYRNPDTKPGTAEAGYTYFCNPAELSSHEYTNTYGIRNLNSCLVSNGGNWYFQPLNFCAAFVMNNATISVKFTAIDYATQTSVHSVYSDLDCTIPIWTNSSSTSGRCWHWVNDPTKALANDGTTHQEEVNSFNKESASYQILIPDAYNVVISTSSAAGFRITSVLVSFIGLFSLCSSSLN